MSRQYGTIQLVNSQFQSVGAVRKLTRRGNILDFHCEHGRVRIAILSDGIVRVRATQAGEFGPNFSYAVAKKKWSKVTATVRDGKVVTLRTKKLLVTIAKAPLRIEFAGADGTALNGDQQAHGMGWEGTKCRSHR